MKIFFFAAAALIFLSSCDGVGMSGSGADSTSYADPGSIYRDQSITPANSYSDLFLDSNAIASFIQKENLGTTDAQMLRNFYTVRNNEFAWFTSQGLTEQAKSFWSVHNKGNTSDKEGNRSLKERMDSLVQKDTILISGLDSSYVQTELALTASFVKYASANNGAINRSNMYWVVPAKKMDPVQLADSLLNRKKDTAGLSNNKAYAALKQQLATLYNAAKNGGWQPLTAKGLKKGSRAPAVTALKKRLQITGDYVPGDTSNVFSDSLANAIKDLQRRSGVAATGAVNDSLIQVLNVPVEQRIAQVILNLNRLMWMPAYNDSTRIEVNIPAQMLYAYEGSNRLFEMPVIIGKEGTGTIAFSGRINQVVFNPTWNIPQSIVKNEILPAMRKDPGYLKKKNMEIVKQSGDVPVIKQLPGKDNALGKVKFLFPNSFDIYLHDTPDKSLFARKNRALSHGCIRVADAEKLAQYILRDQKEWTPEKIRSAMSGGGEQTVAVKNPQPVHITYLSVWVDETGKLNYRNDIYGHDKRTIARMFTAGSNFHTTAAVEGDSVNMKNDTSRRNITRPE